MTCIQGVACRVSPAANQRVRLNRVLSVGTFLPCTLSFRITTNKGTTEFISRTIRPVLASMISAQYFYRMSVSFQKLLVLAVVILLLSAIATRTRRGALPKESSLQGAALYTSPLIVSNTVSIYQTLNNTTPTDNVLLGVIRYHYDKTRSSCDNILHLGVGTLMSVTDYDKISKSIASKNAIVVIVADHNVNRFAKTSPQKYAMLHNGVMHQLSQLLPGICGHAFGDDNTIRLLFGGHSASGQAALQAWQQGLLDTGDRSLAFLGLDPYEVSNKTIDQQVGLVIPSLSWGFTKTTCLVNKEKAATAAYEMTKSSRVLYTFDNANAGSCGAMAHCVFTDRGCALFVCSAKATFEWVHNAVAEGIGIFLQCLRDALPFDQCPFEPAKTLPCNVQVYVNKQNTRRVETLMARRALIVTQ